MDGGGFYRWPDGRIYEGQFEKSQKHGFGRMFWPNGQAFDG